jgi:two-component system repressor protein LuxO
MSQRRTILIIEDSPTLAMTSQAYLEPLGHITLIAGDGAAAFAMLRDRPVDCVLLDLKLPDIDGIEILEDIRRRPDPPAVIVVTANASLSTAVRAVRGGAFDYLVKPFAPERLLTTVGNALQTQALRREVETLRRTVEHTGFAGFVGSSAPMQAVYRIIEAAANSNASVFITGESGTGKELVAEALHKIGQRQSKPFVALNCAAIPHDLMESTIFGHVKGSFSGAVSDQEGAAAQANGGTLFLDELGEMDVMLQTKLLRFIQTGRYQRVGDPRPRQADIRFIAATNRDPLAAIASGTLREDLFYRLNVVPIRLPALRERGDDILLIARHFLQSFTAEEHKKFTGFTPEVELRLLALPWPGNVRQLQNVIRNITVLHDGTLVTLDMLPALETIFASVAAPPDMLAPAPATPSLSALPSAADAIEPLAVAERAYIENAIALCGGNLQLAARRLGISPSTIYRKKEGWGVEAIAV